MTDLWRGVSFWFRGWTFLLARPRLFVVAIVPLILSLIMASAAIFWLYSFLPSWSADLVAWAFHQFPIVAKIFYYPLVVIGGLIILVAGIFVAYVVQSLIAIPFYIILAEKTLAEIGAKSPSPAGFRSWFRHSAHMFLIGIVKAVVFLSLGLILFLTSFFPGLNVIAIAGPLLLMAYDLLDYSYEALGFGLRQRLRYSLRQKGLWVGMAFGLGLTMVVPGLTLLIAPGAVVGAALQFDQIKRGNSHEPSRTASQNS